MSASREKKKRQELLANGTADPRAAREAEQRSATRKANILYGSLAAVFVVVAIFLVVFNSGIIERNKTALTIDGEQYTVAQAAYYYQNAYQSFLNSQEGYLYTALGMLDTSKPLSQQSFSEEQTWAEHFKESAVENMRFIHAAKTAAQADGMTLESEELEAFDSAVAARKSEASANGYTYKSYLRAMFGANMTPSVYEACLKDQLLATKYASAHYDSLSYTDQEILDYYEENKNSYDLVDCAYVTVSGGVPAKTDDEGNTVEATDEEKAAAMAQAKETAEAILAEYEAGGNLERLAEQYDATYTAEEEMTYRSGTIGDWLFDESRRAGDTEVLEDASSYYVAVFNSRQRDETLDYSVRHILVTAANLELGEGEEATEELLTAKAQEILDSWDGTEEGFASLAKEYSQDGGSNTNGGLYEDVAKNRMVAAFQNWCYESGRKPGDTGIVYNSGTGAHIMYFVGYGSTQYWHYACESAMRSEAYSQWQTDLMESATAELDESGMRSIG